jgi:hypothetical protein
VRACLPGEAVFELVPSPTTIDSRRSRPAAELGADLQRPSAPFVGLLRVERAQLVVHLRRQRIGALGIALRCQHCDKTVVRLCEVRDALRHVKQIFNKLRIAEAPDTNRRVLAVIAFLRSPT